MEASAIADAILHRDPDKRAGDVFHGLSEVRQIGGTQFLTRAERVKRDRRRLGKRRSDPAAALKKKAAFRRGRVKREQGLKRFAKSSAGKKKAKAVGKARRMGITSWVDQPSVLNRIDEANLDTTPFVELRVAAEAFASPTGTKSVQAMLDDMIQTIIKGPELLEDLEEFVRAS